MVSGDGRGGVGPRTDHLSSQKFDFGTDIHDGVFGSSHSHHTAYPLVSTWSRCYPICSSSGYLFSVTAGGFRGYFGPKTTHISSKGPPPSGAT